MRDIVRDILALSVSQELRMNLYRCTEPSPFFIEFMTPVRLLLKPLAYLAEDFILDILIERRNPGTVAAAFLLIDP